MSEKITRNRLLIKLETTTKYLKCAACWEMRTFLIEINCFDNDKKNLMKMSLIKVREKEII